MQLLLSFAAQLRHAVPRAVVPPPAVLAPQPAQFGELEEGLVCSSCSAPPHRGASKPPPSRPPSSRAPPAVLLAAVDPADQADVDPADQAARRPRLPEPRLRPPPVPSGLAQAPLRCHPRAVDREEGRPKESGRRHPEAR